MKSDIRSWRSTNVFVPPRKKGLIGLLSQMWATRRITGTGHVRKMQLLETLSLGGKKQLMLVQCGNDQFLVGGGLETVETIVRIDNVSAASSQEQGDL